MAEMQNGKHMLKAKVDLVKQYADDVSRLSRSVTLYSFRSVEQSQDE